MTPRSAANTAWGVASMGQLRDPDSGSQLSSAVRTMPSPEGRPWTEPSSLAGGGRVQDEGTMGENQWGYLWGSGSGDGAAQQRTLMQALAAHAGRMLPRCNYADLAQFAVAFAVVRLQNEQGGLLFRAGAGACVRTLAAGRYGGAEC